MLRANFVPLFVRVLLLAAAGISLDLGAASAHERHASIEYNPFKQAAFAPSPLPANIACKHSEISAENPDQILPYASTPCSEENPSDDYAGSCCSIACHAALVAPPIELIGSAELLGLRIVELVGRLEGRSRDRAERPPKRN